MSTTTSLTQSETTSLLSFASESTRSNLSEKLAAKQLLYPIRRIKTKGAVVVIAWNYFALITFHYLVSHNKKLLDTKTYIDRHEHATSLALLTMWIFYPLAGWLADVRIGRYKTLRCSVWIIWIGIVLSTALVVVTKFYESTESWISWLVDILHILMAVGLSGFQANIIQFGVDQLTDASSTEIRAFVVWYNWSIASSGVIINLFLYCVPEQYTVLKMLFVAISLTCAVCIDLLFNDVFVKEPVTANPFRLVLKVIKYAIKNKSPRQRSAFTYWEEKPPSRIDFGKDKYGGPFTNEQVEDVKTFLRMSIAMSISSIFIGAMVITTFTQDKMMFHLSDPNFNEKSFSNCLARRSISFLYVYALVVFVPVYEFIIRPLFHRYIPSTKIMTKFLIGMLLVFLTVFMQMTIEVVGHTVYNDDHTNVTCLLQSKKHTLRQGHTLGINYKWIAVPGLVYGLGFYTIGLAAIEFVCAQSPYSMKGILFGFIYFIYGVSTIVTFAIFYPFSIKNIEWNSLGCGIWFFLLVLVIIAVTIVLFSCIMRWYKIRDRDDDQPNIQIFAERYYETYAGSKAQKR